MGQATNLNLGLHANIQNGDFLYPSNSDTIFTNSESITKENALSAEFDPFPYLDFCDNYTHLVQTFFDYIQPSDSFKAAGFMFQPGQETDTAYELADLIGVKHEDADLFNSTTSFVLARQWKFSKRVSIEGDPEIGKGLNATLNPADPPSYYSYMDVVNWNGSHYVSGYVLGDFVYQVFAYDKEDYKIVKDRFPPNMCYGAYPVIAFPPYTEVKNDYEGYSKYYGPLKIASQDSRFEDILPFTQDLANNVNNSIFRLFADDSTYDKLNGFNTETVVGLNLTSLNILIYDVDFNYIWYRMMQGSFYTKFGVRVNPEFPPASFKIDYSAAYSQFSPLYPTMTPTYFLGMKYLYIDLSTVQILQPEYVKMTFLFADTIEVNTNVSIPGTENVIIFCNNFLSKSVGDSVPEISLSVDPHDSKAFKLYVVSFRGTVKFTNSKSSSQQLTIQDGHSLILKKSAYQPDILVPVVDAEFRNIVPNVTMAPFLYADTGEVFNYELLNNSFEEGLHYFTTSLENILNFNIGEDGPEAAYYFSYWMVFTLGETVQKGASSTIQIFYTRALTLQRTKNYKRSSFPISVPYLSYTMYEDTINALLASAEEYGDKIDNIEQLIRTNRLEEKIAEDQAALNKYIQNIAKFLLEQNKAEADKQEDFVEYYKKIVEDKENALHQALKQQNSYYVQLSDQQYEVEVAQNQLTEAMEGEVSDEVFQLIVTVTQDIVELFTTESPASLPSQLEALREAIDKIKASLAAIEAFNEMMKSVENNMTDFKDAIDSLKGIDPTKVADIFPTELDWDRLDSQVGDTLSTIPDGIGNHFDYVSRLYTAIGRQYVSISQKICEIQYEIVLNLMQEAIYQKQYDKLKELSDLVNQEDISTDDAMNIDLFSLGTSFQASQATVLIQLLDVMQEQDGALGYFTLQPPTVLTRYDVLSVKNAMAANALAALNAYKSFQPPPHEVEELKEITIPAVAFQDLNGTGHKFKLGFKTSVFSPYVRVRVTEIQAYVSNVNTSTGKLFVMISGGGNYFLDRGLDRQELNYTTFSHEYPFAYSITDGQITEGNRLPPDSPYNLLTPFTTWNFQIPENAIENKGLMNSSARVALTLKFRIYAIRKDPKTILLSDSSSDSDVIDAMSANPTTYGWDVACVMDAEKITELYAEMYKSEEDSGVVKHIDCSYNSSSTSKTKITNNFTSTVGPPLISFIVNQPNQANLTMLLIDAVLVTESLYFNDDGSLFNNQTQITDYHDGEITTTILMTNPEGEVVFNDSSSKPVDEQPKIEGIMMVSKFTGTVDQQRHVIINFAQGTFDTKLTLDPNVDNALSGAIKEYFRDVLPNTTYVLGTLLFNITDTPPSLQPSLFQFSTEVYEGRPKGVLTLFIKTSANDSSSDQKTTLNLDVSPLPTNRSAALIISNKVLINHFILPSLQKTFGDSIYSTSTTPPITPYKVLGKKDGTYTINGQGFPMSSFDVEISSTGRNLSFAWNENWSVKYYYHFHMGQGCIYNCDGTTYDYMPAHLKANSESDLIVNIDSDNSVISFPSIDASVSFSYDKPKPSIWAEVIGGLVTNQVANAEKSGEALKGALSDINIDMSSASVFAVSNLLFPGQKAVDLQSAYIAQDLVLFGDVLTEN